MDHCKLCGVEIADGRTRQFGGLCPACTREQVLERRITKLENFVYFHFYIGLFLLIAGFLFFSFLTGFDVNWGSLFILLGGILFLSSLVIIIGGKKRARKSRN